MSKHIHTVGDLRRAIAKHPDDFPIDWYVDTSDYSSRESQGLPILVSVSVIKRSVDEMDGAPDHVKERMLFINIG